MQGELVKTTTSDGLELAGFWVDRKSDTAVFHNHGTAGDFYTHHFLDLEAEKLAKAGVSFLTANNRGHDVFADIRRHQGGKIDWTTIGGAFEKFEDCLLDIKSWIDFLTDRGVKKVILQSHSLTQKILYYSSQISDSRVAGQIHLSPCNDAGYMEHLLGKTSYRVTNDKIRRMVEEEGRAKEMLPPELSVVCPMAAQAYYGYCIEDGVGNLFPYHNPDSPQWDTLSSIKLPLLAVFGGADTFIKPSINQAADLWRQKAFNSTSLQVEIIPEAPHSFVGHEDSLVDMISRWLADNPTN